MAKGKVSLYHFTPYREMRFEQLGGVQLMSLGKFRELGPAEQVLTLFELGDPNVKVYGRGERRGQLKLF